MGGEKEFTTPAKSTDDGNQQGQTIGNLRIHENKGEVHFHDDSNNLKVAVKVDKMYAEWEKLASGKKKKFKHIDAANGTELRIEIVTQEMKGRPDLTDALIEVRPLSDKKKKEALEAGFKNTTPEFQKFDQFIKG